MEDLQEGGIEPQETEPAPEPPTEPDSGALEPPAEGDGAGEGELEQAAAPSYEPNYKFKVLEEEKEFDEFLRGAIKDEETEKQVRELYEKAYGLEHVKAERQKIRDEYKQLKEESDALNGALGQLSEYVNKDDLHTFFQELGIPEQKVLQYAIERAQYSDLSPEQRQQWDQQYNERQRAYMLERQNQELLAAQQQSAVNQRVGELESYLQSPEISSVVQSFDSRVGKPGSFMAEVIKRGQYYASLPEPQDISVQQAVNEVLNLVGGISQQQAAAAEIPVEQKVIVPEDKPTIPNIKGSGTSPTKKLPNSIDDLRKLQKQAMANR